MHESTVARSMHIYSSLIFFFFSFKSGQKCPKIIPLRYKYMVLALKVSRFSHISYANCLQCLHSHFFTNLKNDWSHFKKLFSSMNFTYLAYLVFFWTLFKSWILLEMARISWNGLIICFNTYHYLSYCCTNETLHWIEPVLL